MNEQPPIEKHCSQSQFLDFLSVILTVFLFYLAFPSGGYGLLSWVAIIPIIISLNRTTDTRNAFMLGLLAATLGWMCSIWWAAGGISRITDTSINLIIPIVFIFCLISALPYALGCWCHVKFKLGRSASGALISASIFTALVNFIPHILPGNLAHALYLQPLFIQVADLGGVAIVFFIIHAVSILTANGYTASSNNKKSAFSCFVLSIVIFLSNSLYGNNRINNIDEAIKKSDKHFSVLLIQPNISITKRTRKDWLKEQTNLAGLLKNKPAIKDIDLVIFPEVPVPISSQYFDSDKNFFDTFFLKTNLLLTAVRPQGTTLKESDGYFNTIELHQSNGDQHHYAKQVLLPFGEYIPFANELPWLSDIFGYSPNYLPGSTTADIPLSLGDKKINLIPLICYEAVFDDLVHQAAELGGEVIINTSNDAWFEALSGKNTHFALSLFRVVEFRKPLIRVTNNGLTRIVSPNGKLVEGSSLSANIATMHQAKVELIDETSFYQKHPDFFRYLLLSFITIALAIKWWRPQDT